MIEAIAQRFSIPENVIRRLWREAPVAFGQPPTWHLAQILRELQRAGERAWPASDAQWQARSRARGARRGGLNGAARANRAPLRAERHGPGAAPGRDAQRASAGCAGPGRSGSRSG